MNLPNSDEEEMDPDWNKVKRDMEKVGLKDGLSDGRDSNFQRSFDQGYQDGFQNGFELGKLKFQRSLCQHFITPEITQILEDSTKALCVMCTTEKENEDVADIRKKQTDICTSQIEKIKSEINQKD